MKHTNTSVASDIRSWARGCHPVEAGSELLLRAFGGRFAASGLPWIRDEDGSWIDFDVITDSTTRVYSGGERRLLAVAASIGGNRHVNLNDALPGLDRGALDLVLAAIAHAAGSHQHSDLHVDSDTGTADVVQLDSLYPWPGEQPQGQSAP